MKALLLAALAVLSVFAPAQTSPLAETKSQKDARMQWWREARFGIFVHWGLYAVPAGNWNGKEIGGAAEWLLNDAQIKVQDYEPLIHQFNPTKFDARKFVGIVKDSGAKYMVITSKHHEGFGLWPSKLGDWNIGSTPYQKDILKALAKECQRQGVRLCFYHSIMDWHHPDYLPRRSWDPRPEIQPDFERYVTYLKGQLKEILTNYGPIGILWFDGQWESTWTHERGVDLYSYVRTLQPGIIVNNRVDSGNHSTTRLQDDPGPVGDYGTPEQEIPASGQPGVDWESCMTMNDTWGFSSHDTNWKSAQTLVDNVIDCASKGGNYLLNVGPTAAGLIPEASVERLHKIGQWLRRNGEAIYGTQAGPFPKPLAWGRVTRKGNTLFLHVFDTKATEVELPGLTTQVNSAHPLRLRSLLPFRRSGNSVFVTVPARAAGDDLPVVAAVELAGPPEVVVEPLHAAADGSAALQAIDATVTGGHAHFENGRDCIGYWTDTGDTVSWDYVTPVAGTYKVALEYACATGSGGSTYTVAVGDQVVSGTVAETGTWDSFASVDLGTVTVASPGKVRVIVSAKSMPLGAVMNLRAIRLVRATR